jgi:SAM-dependent methyltransferase
MQTEPPKRSSLQSNIEWQAWGHYDPLYGVSSIPGRNRRGKNPWTDEEFYARGAEDWTLLSRHWEQYGIVKESCLEIGCGAGRMTRVLSKTFGRVYGCDVSPGMISAAEPALKDSPNVRFDLTDGRKIPLDDGSVTAAFSTIVFQHLSDPLAVIDNFAEIYRCLSPGGTMMINLPLHDFPFTGFVPALRLLYRVGRFFDNFRANCKRLLLRLPIAYTRIGLKFGFHMHATSYDYPWLYSQLIGLGFDDIEVRSFWVESEQRLHYYVFGRKPTASAEPRSARSVPV